MSSAVDAPRPRALALSAWCTVAAFGAYFCTYAFRKPFTVGTFEDVTLLGVGYKSALLAAQVAGYTLSKFIGIRVIASLPPQRRAAGIVLLVGVAEVALFFFGLVPPPYNLVFLFLNGLPLGMVFGLVLGFLEGRRATEALAAGLCASFIVSDGVVKTVGGYVLSRGVSEYWMPFVVGLLFLGPLLFFVWMLARIPPPNLEDVARRRARPPMNAEDRRRFFRNHAPGLVLLVTVYLLLTVLRSVRSDFAVELWTALGYPGEPALFTWSELLVALGVVLINGGTVLIADNRRAFFTALAASMGGFALVILALAGLAGQRLGGFGFMVLVGLGVYVPYVAVHTTLFERLIALLRDPGNLGYLMYLADAFGYLGYAAVLIVRDFLWRERSAMVVLDFFVSSSWGIALASLLLLALAWAYFARRTA